jgi:hypothetical protein
MAWPDNMDEVAALGFPREVLYDIKAAFEEKEIKETVDKGLYNEFGFFEFNFEGHKYEAIEATELIYQIKRIE